MKVIDKLVINYKFINLTLLTLKDGLEILDHYTLNAEELLVVYLLFLASQEENHSEYLLNYYSPTSKIQKTPLKGILLSLQEKGIINKSYKIPTGEFDPEGVEFNTNFLKKYLKYSGDLGKDLVQNYPNYINVHGRSYDISNYAKTFNSEEDFCFAYGKAIGWKQEAHNEVLTILKWATESDQIQLGNICDFVISKQWTRLVEAKDKNYNLSYDYTTSL